MARQPDEWREAIENAKADVEKLSRELVHSLADAKLALRLLGVAFVLVGILLGAAGNLA